MTIKYDLKITAPNGPLCDRKAKALAGLGSKFDAKTLEALDKNGPQFLNHPSWGEMIRGKLGL